MKSSRPQHHKTSANTRQNKSWVNKENQDLKNDHPWETKTEKKVKVEMENVKKLPNNLKGNITELNKRT